MASPLCSARNQSTNLQLHHSVAKCLGDYHITEVCHKSHLFFYVLQVKSQSQLWKALTLTLWLLLVCQWCPWWDGLHFAACWHLWSKVGETSPRNGKLLSIPQGTLTVLHTHIIIYFCFRSEPVEYELPSHYHVLLHRAAVRPCLSDIHSTALSMCYYLTHTIFYDHLHVVSSIKVDRQ